MTSCSLWARKSLGDYDLTIISRVACGPFITEEVRMPGAWSGAEENKTKKQKKATTAEPAQNIK